MQSSCVVVVAAAVVVVVVVAVVVVVDDVAVAPFPSCVDEHSWFHQRRTYQTRNQRAPNWKILYRLLEDVVVSV